jgi:hypothetical protein
MKCFAVFSLASGADHVFSHKKNRCLTEIRKTAAGCVMKLLLRDSTNGATLCASAALNASGSVDLVLAVALRDSADGAGAFASAAGYTIIGNLVSHKKIPPL